ncbi:hypothetical protein MTY59_00940 [Mycobacterium senriense]|uniref:Uncharacterized protein n=1 Tax=Mycobacterium senriense TaxID=2775496 RepID=A0ABN6I9D7_9MYCO|nr:hypothetical protein MTY59_00940 [Mycobacterium senriense]
MVSAEDAVAGDHVVDVGRLEADPLNERGEAPGEQGLRVHSVQAAVGAAATAGRADRVENPGVDDGLRSSWVGRYRGRT